MKYFWHIISFANTLLFALLVFGFYTEIISINTASRIRGDIGVEGDIGIEGSVDTNIQEIPTVDVRSY